MTMKPEQTHRLLYLLGALRDEVITEAEFAELDRLLEQNPTAQDYYLDYIYLCTDLCNLQAAIKSDGSDTRSPAAASTPPLTLEMLQVWGDYERNAETLNLPQPADSERRPVEKRPVTMPPRRVSKQSFATLAVAVAAVLVLILYVHLNPRYSYEVATLVNAVDAEWTGSLPLQKGTRLSVSASEPIQLKKGVIEIASDLDVTITIEAPAQFSFISPNEISMAYGRLFASVSPSGSGFSVQTQNSKIIDLGTRFGVASDMRGDTELHVFKGSTILLAGQKGRTKQTVEVRGGRACRVDSINSNVMDIELNHNLFAQGIDPDTGLLITGGKQIDLADIVGGGSGTGQGSPNSGIRWNGNPLTGNADGRFMPLSDWPEGYVRVPDNPLIDGIFIPHCKGQQPLVLSSTTAALNLDEFIKADTNGLLTLVLAYETNDSNATFWFTSKEGAGTDRSQCPALVFPNAPATGPVRVTTADGDGADAYVSNDTLRRPAARLGRDTVMACRYLKDLRIRLVYLRFDIRALTGADLSEAVLNLYLSFGNRYRDLHVYGLRDGPADYWDEASLCFNNAPGLRAAAFGNYQLDPAAFDRLGTFAVVDNRVASDPVPVTADGTCLWNAPSTACQTDAVISNAGEYTDPDGQRRPLLLADTECGTAAHPVLALHANAGITFNLQAIRNDGGPVALERFTAVCGIAQPAASEAVTTIPSASFYVLLDGREVFSAVDLSPDDAPASIDIDLTARSRYLTLVATQGTDNSIANDRCLFMNPTITVK